MSAEVWWPDIDEKYSVAREALVGVEHRVTTAIEDLAAERRALPPGGLVRDYVFNEGPVDVDADGEPVTIRLEELFGEFTTLMLYNFMFDGRTTQPCRMCTSLIDGFEGAAADLQGRVGFAVVAPAPLGALREYGRHRRWRNVRLLADTDGIYSRDSGGLTASGELKSLMTVFTRRDGSVRHFYTSGKPPTTSGQDDRHLDALWTLWGALDITPEGRQDWRPQRPSRR